MQVVVVPKNAGAPMEQVQEWIALGWICLPGVTVQGKAVGIVVPGGRPSVPGFGDYDVWVSPPEPLIPVAAVVKAVLDLDANGGDLITLNNFCKQLLGAPLQEVRNVVRSADKKD